MWCKLWSFVSIPPSLDVGWLSWHCSRPQLMSQIQNLNTKQHWLRRHLALDMCQQLQCPFWSVCIPATSQSIQFLALSPRPTMNRKLAEIPSRICRRIWRGWGVSWTKPSPYSWALMHHFFHCLAFIDVFPPDLTGSPLSMISASGVLVPSPIIPTGSPASVTELSTSPWPWHYKPQIPAPVIPPTHSIIGLPASVTKLLTSPWFQQYNPQTSTWVTPSTYLAIVSPALVTEPLMSSWPWCYEPQIPASRIPPTHSVIGSPASVTEPSISP